MSESDRVSPIRSVIVLISGTSGSQIILVAASPILTRMYTPEDFAILALFTAMVQVLGVIANGRYDLAIFLPQEEAKAYKLAVLGVVISTAVSLLVLIGVMIGREAAANWWNMPELALWLWLLPVAVFFGGVFAVAQPANVRLGSYKIVAVANIMKALVQSAIQVMLGLVMPGAGPLVIGRTLANVAANGRLIRSGISHIGGPPAWRWNELWVLAKQYKRFPAFSAPAGLVNVSNANLLNFALPVILGPATLGFYSLAMRVLGAPLQQIAGPIGQVFMREAAEELRQKGTAGRSFLRGLAALSGISLVLFGALYFLIEPAFAILFGAEWDVAGRYAAILIPLFAVRFIVSPLSTIANLTDNRHALGINLLLLLVSGFVLVRAYVGEWGGEQLFTWVSLSQCAVYFCYLPVLYWLAAHRGLSEQ